MFSTCPFVCLSVRYHICEHDIFKTNEPILMQIGTSGLGRGHEMIDFRTRRSKVKVTLSRSYISRHGRGINFDPFGRENK